MQRAENSNEMLENLVQTLLNHANNGEVSQLLDAGIIAVIQKFFKMVIDSSRDVDGLNEEEEGIDLLSVMPHGTL